MTIDEIRKSYEACDTASFSRAYVRELLNEIDRLRSRMPAIPERRDDNRPLRIMEKCYQYMEVHNICDEELHAVMDWIYREAIGARMYECDLRDQIDKLNRQIAEKRTRKQHEPRT